MPQFDEVHNYLTVKEKRSAVEKWENKSKTFPNFMPNKTSINFTPNEDKFLGAWLRLQRGVEIILELIGMLNRKDKVEPSDFKSALNDLMKNDGWLPWFLDRLDEEFNSAVARHSIIPNPDMEFLFDLSFGEAIPLQYRIPRWFFNF
jgi:hypothetical protein